MAQRTRHTGEGGNRPPDGRIDHDIRHNPNDVTDWRPEEEVVVMSILATGRRHANDSRRQALKNQREQG